MSRSPTKRVSLSNYLFNPSRPVAKQQISTYQSPPTTPDLVSAKVQKRKEFEDLQVKSNASRLELQVSLLNTKLQQRDIECLELRSTCERLETELASSKDQIEQFKHATAVLKHENHSKDKQISQMMEDLSQHTKLESQEPVYSLYTLEEYKLLMQEINSLERNFKRIANENQEMKEDILEVFKLRETYLSLPQNITKIKLQVEKLRKMLESLRRGNSINMNLFHKEDKPSLSPEDMFKDCQQVKEDLKQIFFMVADFNAEQSGNNICVQQ